MPISMTKIRRNHQFPQEKFVSHFPFLERLPERFTNSFADLLIKEFWNLISWQYFGVYRVNGLYNGNYGQWYIQAVWEASIPVWVPKLWHAKNTFQVFFFSVVFQQKLHWCSDQWFHKASNYFKMVNKTNIHTEEKNNETRRQSKRRNCLQKCFHSFKYVIDHANVCFFFLNSLQDCLHSLKENIRNF